MSAAGELLDTPRDTQTSCFGIVPVLASKAMEGSAFFTPCTSSLFSDTPRRAKSPTSPAPEESQEHGTLAEAKARRITARSRHLRQLAADVLERSGGGAAQRVPSLLQSNGTEGRPADEGRRWSTDDVEAVGVQQGVASMHRKVLRETRELQGRAAQLLC